nr:hypothetical protein [Tanacetum cinerariifolium]
MSSTLTGSVMQATSETDAVVTKERLSFLVNQEIMEDALRVEDYKKDGATYVYGLCCSSNVGLFRTCVVVRDGNGSGSRMARQLKDSVRRRSGYIGAFKALPSGVDSSDRLKFLERMCLQDMEKGTRLLLMMKETEMKIGEKIVFVTALENDVVV